MFIDAHNKFCSSQALSADANLTNVIDLGIARNLGDGEQLAVVINAEVSADHTTGDEVYTFNVVTDDNAALSSPTTIATKSPLFSELVAGMRVIIPIPIGVALEQFLGVAFDGGGTTPTVTVSAFLQPIPMIDKVRSYVDNSRIS